MSEAVTNYLEAGIIIIGNEVLSGETVDTNSQYIGKKLNELGIMVKRKLTIPDREEDIMQAIDLLWKCCNILLISGGLGPTNDDITKKTLTTYFKSDLVFNEKVFEQIKNLLKNRFPQIKDVHRNQALLPANAIALQNKLGTAAGILIEEDGKILIALPGVPYELRGLIDDKVFPLLKKKAGANNLLNLNIKTIGIGESYIAEIISDIEESLPSYINLAYLPSIGQVKLRLTAQNADIERLTRELDEIKNRIVERIPEYIYGYGDLSFPEAIGILLKDRNASLSTAESCTGGYIAHEITSIPGSSDYFKGSIIAYSNEVKVNHLGVSQSIINREGAVSQACAEAMAKGIMNKFKTTYAIATTGIAGPDGGSEDKPVGTVCLAVASENEIRSEKIVFDRGRIQNIQYSSLVVLNMLRKAILKMN